MAKQIVRVRCPCCQMMTDLDTMAANKDEESIVRVYQQTLGGKIPEGQKGYEYKKGRGKAKGAMNYEEITDQLETSQLQSIKSWFIHRAKEFLEKEGE